MPRYWVSFQRNLLRAILPLLRRLPPRASTALLTWIGWLEFRLVPGVQEHFLRAAERGRTDLGGAWADRDVALRLACSRVHWRTRDRLLDRLSDEDALARFEVLGREHLDEAYSGSVGSSCWPTTSARTSTRRTGSSARTTRSASSASGPGTSRGT
jgi:hypothetical protein